MGATKPYIQAACICERVIVDTDGSPSVIRIVGRFVVELAPEWPPNMSAPPFSITLFVSFSGGDYHGIGKLAVTITKPDGETTKAYEQSIDLTQDAVSTHTKLDIQVHKPMAGTYWFDVLWNDSREAKIPLLVEIKRQSAPAKTGKTQEGPAT